MSALPQHLDIHLIRVLYLLLTEKNVSRAAIRLNQPQPSVSASLRRLRDLTGDALLVRGKGGMVPTPHGERLLEPARHILEQTANLFSHKSAFDARTAQCVFHIAAPDFLDSRLLPEIIVAVHRASPSSKVIIHTLADQRDALTMLSDGGIDVIITNWEDPPPHLRMSVLFDDEIACFMRADCPYALRTGTDDMSLADYLTLPHIAPLQTLSGGLGMIDSVLAKHGVARHIAAETAYFGMIPSLLARSELVVTTARQFMRSYEENRSVKRFRLPLPFPPMKYYQLWHDRVHQATEQKWLRALIGSTSANLQKKNFTPRSDRRQAPAHQPTLCPSWE
jgi:DNA-binding transcriptional LysR family regulator